MVGPSDEIIVPTRPIKMTRMSRVNLKGVNAFALFWSLNA